MDGRLICLGSSSHGNGFILDCDDQQLIIECGVPFKECNKALKGAISGVQGLIVSHGHRDHVGYIKQYQQHGLRIYSNVDVASCFDGVATLEPMEKYQIGKFTVVPLRVFHGDCPNFAYIIILPDGQKILFATDLHDFQYQISGINHALVEANYSEELRLEALMKNPDIRSASGNHMELSACIRVLNRLKSPNLRSVILLHLSDNLSNEKAFKEQIYAETGIKAEVAEKGKTFILKSSDF